MANYREPQWLLPNEKNLAMPASDATVGSGLAEDRQSLYSMDFDGSNDYIDCGDNDLLSFGNGSSDSPFTVSSWIYAKGSSTFPFFDKYPDAGTWALREYRMEVFGTDKVVLIIYDGSASARHEIYSDSLITRDQWQHVVITYDGRGGATAGDGVKIYINGSESTTTIFSYGTYVAMENTTSPVRIGRIGGTYADGKIDETAVWNKALSASEVSALTTASAPANILALSDKPVAYWPLGEQARRGSEWQFPNEVLQSQVFDFDGTDKIDVGTSLASAFGNSYTGDITVSMWFNADTVTSDDGLFTVKTGSTFGNITFLIAGSTVRMYYNNDGTYISGSVSTNQWYNLVGVLKAGDASNTKLYLNGSSVATATTTPSASLNFSGMETWIGNYWAGSNGFDGEMSNVAIWNSDESANIANIYNNGSPQSSYTTTPIAWYKLNATSNYAGLNPNWHNALSFDGSSSQYVIAPLDGKGTGSSPFASGSDLEFTVSFWYFRESSSSQIGVFQWAIPLSSGNPFLLVQQNSNDLKVYYDNNYRTTTTTTTNGWYNITMTRTSSDNIFKAYLNGVEFISYDDGGTIVNQSNAESVYFGNGYNGYFTGKISNAAVWTQAISAEDVLYLYNGGTPQTSLSFEPLSWWKLDNLTTGIQDSGSASNNGTNNGATAVSSSVAVDQWNFDNVSHVQTPTYTSALDFDGSTAEITLDSNSTLSNDTAVSFWMKASSQSGYGQICYGLGSDMAYQYLSTNGSGSDLYVYDGTFYKIVDDAYNGEWNHIVVSYNNTTNEVKGYKNGVLDQTVSATWSNQSFIGFLGARNGIRQLNGLLSNFGIFTGTLDQTAVTSLYNNGTPLVDMSSFTSLDGFWKLDNLTTGIQDSKGSNNGTNNAATEIQTNVLTPRLNGESTTLPSTALVSSDLQFESPYSNFSLDFDGTNDYIDCTDNDMFSFGNGTTDSPFSLSAWIKIDVASNFRLISKFQGSDYEYHFDIGGGGYLQLYLFDGASAWRARYQNSTLNTGQWYHVAATYNGVGGTDAQDGIKIYVDGIRVDDTTVSSGAYTAMSNTNAPLNIARLDSNYANGKIDETAVFNKELTQAEVSSIYNNGYPADLTSLSPVSWWRLGEDAYFVSPNFTVPNQITGAPNGTSANMDQADLVADAPGSYASGVGSSLALADRVGDAPESTANSLSFNMTPLNKISYPAGYVPTQADNVYSMAFDGVSDYFNLGTSLNSTINGVVNNFSISCWIKADAGSGSVRRGIIGNYTTASATGFYLDLINSSANAFTLRAGYHGASGYNLRDNTTTLVANGSTWYNVIVTVSGNTSGDVVVYINGIAENGTTIFSSPSSYTVTANLEVGHIAHGPSNRFSGDIDEVAIFDYALSARQIKQDIYEGTTTGKTADLNNISNLTAPVAWYRMGD